MRRQRRQLEIRFRSWGGRREGAGRKRSKKSRVAHRQRQALASRYPVLVTMKVRREVNRLRTKQRVRVIRQAFVQACSGDGFRIVDWSVQDDHIHLIVEAQSTEALTRGMQGFSVRVAKGLNRLRGTKGTVFADRYHMRVLRTPREVRNARAYVINNYRRHAVDTGYRVSRTWVDAFSSWAFFDGFKDLSPDAARRAIEEREGPPPVAEPRTWLLNVGWRRHGLVRVAETPKSCRRRA